MEFQIAIRNLLKRPFLNSVKVIGLTLGLTGSMVILLFIRYQLSYDGFHKNSSRIYRFTTTAKADPDTHFAKVFEPAMLPEMANYFPEIENYVRLAPVLGGVIKYKEQFIRVEEAFQCDTSFFNIFDVELLKGTSRNILNKPGSLVISESFALNVFGKIDPLGEIITLPSGQYYEGNSDFIVRGVMKDLPPNGHFHPQFLTTPTDKEELLNRASWIYILLQPGVSPERVKEKFERFYLSQINKNPDEQLVGHLQKITTIHLNSNKLREIESNSSTSVIYTLAIAAFLLLSMAFINFVNLGIGMTVFSEKYLSVSKILGATQHASMRYFLLENTIIGVLSVIISVTIIVVANVTVLNKFGMQLLEGNGWTLVMSMLAVGALIVFTGFLLSIRTRISKLTVTSPSDGHRKGISMSLIVFQNIISICLVVAVVTIHQQTNYAISSSIGSEDSDLICFQNVHSEVQFKFETFKEELLKNTSIRSVSAMLDAPGEETNDMMSFTMEGFPINADNSQENMIGVLPCDYSFAEALHLNFLGGRNFSERNNDSEGSGEYIINESAMRKLNYVHPEDIVGKEFKISFAESINIPKGKIIGVVKDFHLSSLKRKIEPLVFFKRKDLWLLNFIIRFQPGKRESGIADVSRVWKNIFPDQPMQFEYVNDIYRKVYKNELLETNLLSLFTAAALAIGVMGLVGLSLLITQRRMKEIAIRKVYGAGAPHLMMMLSWNFIKWIVVAFVLAVPISFYAMNLWLESFAYKTSINWWIFIVAGCVSVIVAFVSVSLQSYKATATSPVDILRNN